MDAHNTVNVEESGSLPASSAKQRRVSLVVKQKAHSFHSPVRVRHSLPITGYIVSSV